MKITSPVIGEIEVSPDRIIEFPNGLPGFETARQFTLLHPEGNDAPNIFVLQGVDNPEVTFTVTTPDILGLNYEFTLTDDEIAALQLGNPDDVSVLLIVRNNDTDAAAPQVNVMGPLVVNIDSRRAIQKIIGRVDTSVTLRAVA
ncbi:flagellar assembly protein FliW [Zoogloea sp.]|uniref:flagellar assembly protein FliW n=1 Tax=Zoogloea sp. TaxID=49181 RepID=UPI0035B36585